MHWRLCTGGYAPCPQAEVGETITLRGTFIHKFEEKPEIIWRKTGELKTYSKCNPNIGCRDSIQGKTETSLTPKGNNVYEFSLKIKSITAEDFNVWYLKYSGTAALDFFNEPLYSCNLTRLTNGEKKAPLYTDRWIFIRVSLVVVSSILVLAVLVFYLLLLKKRARMSQNIDIIT
jgi:hypothetical protein